MVLAVVVCLVRPVAASADSPTTPLGRFTVTAYHGPQVKGYTRPITATGTIARSGHTIAVDPKVIPLGSIIYVRGVGIRRAEDTGGKIKGRRLDVYMPSIAAARRFGRQQLDVYLVTVPRSSVRRSVVR